MNQAEQAKIFIERALTIFRKVDDRRGEAWELFRLGETCLHLDQLEQALRYDEQALSIFREVGECIGEGVTINHLELIRKPEEEGSSMDFSL